MDDGALLSGVGEGLGGGVCSARTRRIPPKKPNMGVPFIITRGEKRFLYISSFPSLATTNIFKLVSECSSFSREKMRGLPFISCLLITSFFLLLSLFGIRADREDEKKVYVVYMGAATGGKEDHLQLLASVLQRLNAAAHTHVFDE